MPHPLILERFDIVEGVPPVDLSTAANNGDWVSLKGASRVAVILHAGLGTAGDDPTLTIEQAQDVAGTGGKALAFTTIYRKQAATSLAAVGVWTKTTQAAANTYTEATAAEQDALWVVEFAPSELDVNNNFDCIRATVADVGGNAQPGVIEYLIEKVVETAPERQLSAIVD